MAGAGMTTFLDRVPVAKITQQAREVHAGRTLLTLIAALFFALGWLALKVCQVAWLAGAWCAVATREGWRQARSTKRPVRSD